MNFSAQRIQNRFPEWSAVRSNPSSLGARLISTAVEPLEALLLSMMHLQDEKHLLRHWCGVGQTYHIQLNEADYFPIVKGRGISTYTYPVVEGDSHILERVESVEDFLRFPPTRVGASETFTHTNKSLVVSSEDISTINALPFDCQLWFLIRDSTHWDKRTANSDRLAIDQAFVSITGKDCNGKTITDLIFVNDDGVYRGSHIFREVTSLDWGGFNGILEVHWNGGYMPYVEDPYRSVVFTDYESPLRYKIEDFEYDSQSYISLSYVGRRIKFGNEYRKESLENFENEEVYAEVVLLDDQGNPITDSASLVMDARTSKLYLLTQDQTIHVYDPSLPNFTAPSLNTVPTNNILIDVGTANFYPRMGSTVKMWTSLRKQDARITNVVIKRRSPSGLVRYLQADKSWGLSSYSFSSRSADPSRDRWIDLNFNTEYDEIGQWEYEIPCDSELGSSAYWTSVLVGSLQAEASLTLGTSNVTGITFDIQDNLLAIKNSSQVLAFNLHYDYYLAVEESNKLILREEYSSVEVTY